MKTAAEYRAMADECFKWARDAQAVKARASYLELAKVWLDAASKLDGLPPTRTTSDRRRVERRRGFHRPEERVEP
jgi:hypothetical protein